MTPESLASQVAAIRAEGHAGPVAVRAVDLLELFGLAETKPTEIRLDSGYLALEFDGTPVICDRNVEYGKVQPWLPR